MVADSSSLRHHLMKLCRVCGDEAIVNHGITLLNFFDYIHLWNLGLVHNRESDVRWIVAGVVDSVYCRYVISRISRIGDQQTIVGVDREAGIVTRGD